jgi:hypothetical protein
MSWVERCHVYEQPAHSRIVSLQETTLVNELTTSAITAASTLDSIRTRLSADMAGQNVSDRARRKLHLEAAITYAALGGHESKELIDASSKGGDPGDKNKSKAGWEGRGLMPGLTGTNWNEISTPAERKCRNDQLQSLAGIIRASIYLADGLAPLARMTPDGLEAKFIGPFQAAVRKALADEAKGKKPSEGLSESDFTGEDEADLEQQQRDLFKQVSDLGSVETLSRFRPKNSGRTFLAVGFWDENGCHIAREVSVSMTALSAMLPPPNLNELDKNLNGISEHLLLTKAVLKNRPSHLPEDARAETVSEATPMRVSGRTTMLRGGRLDTSLSHLSSPEVVIVTSLLDGATLPAGPFIFHAPARSKFEEEVAPENLRQHFEFDGVKKDTQLNALTFKRKRSGKPARIGLIPARDWGSNNLRNPHAHRLSDAYKGAGVRRIGGDALDRLVSEILDSKEAQASSVEVRLKEGNVLLKVGKASSLRYDGVLDGEPTEDLRLTVPTKDFRAAMRAGVAGTCDKHVGISGDKRGVVCVSWTGHGATHCVYIASVLADGVRDDAGLFQRYDKTSA